MSYFRSNVFDPILIVAQIISLQCCFYASFGLWLIVADTIADIGKSINQIFDYREISSTYDGWMIIGAMVMNAFLGAIALWWIVRRAKKTIDFSATVHIIHLSICICYGGFPCTLSWWLTNIVSFGIMTIFGEWLCMRTELQAIPVGGTLTGGGTDGGNNK